MSRLRNQVVEFKGCIGVGISENVDVTRRISNFNTWFIMFALSFCLLYLLINYLFQKKIENDNKKMVDFIDNIIVVANCLIVLKTITYFYNDAYYDNLYVFSNEIVLVIILTLFSYIVFDLQKNISLDEFAKLLIVGVAVSYVLAIFGGMVGNMDKVLVGVLGIVLIAIILFCKFCRAVVNTKNYKYISNGGVVILVTLPLMTSVYIELYIY